MKLFLSSIIGFLAASPIGPMGLLCLRRTFSQGISSGLVSALGISTAYLLWAYATVHGVSSVSHWIEQNKHPLEAAIGLLFFLYGVQALYTSRGATCPALRRKSGPAEFFSTFFVVLLNPSTFVMFTALFTLFGVAKPPLGRLDSLEIAVSVFAGAVVFWVLAAQIVSHLRNRMKKSFFNNISRISAIAILLFGLAVLLLAI